MVDLSASLFRDFWFRWAFGFFFLASLLGVLMRSFHVVEVPYFDYKNILHSHSHLALLGWGFLMLTGGMIFGLEAKKELFKKYGLLVIGVIVSLLGMVFSFPFQGYGVYSISFSTLHVLVSYGIVYRLLRLLRKRERTIATKLIQLALWFFLVSTLGLWALGPVIATFGRLHELYFMTIQWFLHFQLNGWFVLGVLGLIILMLEHRGVRIQLPDYQIWILGSSVVLTYALVITWAEPVPLFFWGNSIAVLLQGLAYFWVLKTIFVAFQPGLVSRFTRILLLIALSGLVIKASLQLLLVFPSVAVISYTIRMYVIGFLHLVLLGGMTFGMAGITMGKGWISDDRISRYGWKLLITGFVSSEILLFGQGTLIWLKLGFLPEYNLWLFLFSCLFPLSIAVLFIRLFYQKKNEQTTIDPTINFQNQFKNQTMKKSLIWSMGILGILLTSCGGGSDSHNSTSVSSPSEKKEVVADPKGIGEIKSVDLGGGVEASLASEGKAIVDMKCTACHQLNDKRLVGPGFQGITNRRRPEWIMNMITNVDVMLDKDPTAQALLEECLTRMPNQNLSLDDARGILEYLRLNDEDKAGQRDAAIN